MAFNLIRFQTRSPERDLERDRARVGKLRQVLETARAEAESERTGLQRRIDAYLHQAVSLMDSSDGYGARPDEEEREIVDLESRAKAGVQRVAQVTGHISAIDQMLADLASIDPDAMQVRGKTG